MTQGIAPILYYREYEPEDSPFYSIVADITHRCNMACANCYIPNRSIPDMDTDKLQDVLRRLPRRSEIRLIGAEPTMRRDLPDIIRMVRKTGHRPMLTTNGLRLSNPDYVKELKASGLTTVSISMNGVDDDEIYAVMDELRCAKKKMAALKNCHDSGMFININCIIQKGVNESSVGKLISLTREWDNFNPVLRFRNVGQVGRYTLEHDENYTFEELVQITSSMAGVDYEVAISQQEINGYDEERNVLFPFPSKNPNKSSWIKVTDWSPNDSGIPDPNSTRRGRITQDFKIAPFFEHVVLNEGGY